MCLAKLIFFSLFCLYGYVPFLNSLFYAYLYFYISFFFLNKKPFAYGVRNYSYMAISSLSYLVEFLLEKLRKVPPFCLYQRSIYSTNNRKGNVFSRDYARFLQLFI